MAKSLGQIHTVNYSFGPSVQQGHKFIVDCAGELTSQLNHMVRMGNSFKCVGIDMTLQDEVEGAGGQAVNGVIRYYAPTRGRVLAIRDAFHAVMKGMQNKGIDPRSNLNYDFRPILNPPADYENGDSVKNIASIQYDYDNQIWKPLCLDNNPGWQTIFDTWNAQLEPRQGQVGDPTFSTGYNIQLGGVFTRTTGAATYETFDVNPDFVLEEGMYLQTHKDFADDELEEIPFALANADDTSAALQFEWRPDPALYLSVLTGQLEIEILEFRDAHESEFCTIDLAVYVAGWTSIMSDKKRHRSRKGGRKHGRKRHSKK